ncbi:MAG TPA: hypothetical protein VF221_12245 [Chloroflexota bacterium]
MTCSATLTLLLQPGPIPGAASRNGATAGDIPPNPLIEHLPLYPTATRATLPISAAALFQIFPPAYRKVAMASFRVPAGYRDLSDWYRPSMAACGLSVDGEEPLQRPAGVLFAGLSFTSRDGLRRISLLFRPLSPRLTVVQYLAQALDLPPRPARSLLRGPFKRVSVFYQSRGVIPTSQHTYRFTITWPATIARLVTAVNRPTQIAVSGLGSGGTVVFTETAVLSFVRPDGGARRVQVGGTLGYLIVGRTRAVVDSGGMLMKLVDRIVTQRCRHAQTCT